MSICDRKIKFVMANELYSIRHIFCILIVSFSFPFCFFHPQCLDYQPPFKAAHKTSFCGQHKDYGCCTATRDADIKHDFNDVIQRLQSNVSSKCKDFVKDILCLECHPYAAHIYDAERLTFSGRFEKRSVNFPGLCLHSCLGFFDTCKYALSLIARTDKFSSFISTANSSMFCEWATIPDATYCYPDVNNMKLRQSYTRYEKSITVCVKPLFDVFRNPLFAVSPKDNTHRMFIGEQQGIIWVLDKNKRKLDEPFLNISERIINSGSPWDERGLLGMAFHPKYNENGRFFVYYSVPRSSANRSAYTDFEWYWRTRHSIRVSEFVVSVGDPNVGDVDSELAILEIEQPEHNHNGGMLLFDEQGYLNVFVGDGGGRGDPHGAMGNGLNLTALLGKVLRINVDSENVLYSVPADNPFLKFPNVRDEIYAYGIRNIWRCSIDDKDNTMFCGDVGQNKYEEINIIEKGGNYGWRAFEGYSCYDRTLCKQQHKNLKWPILVYNHTIGQSIVGGYVYRGCQNPNLYGKYFYADTMNGRIFAAEKNGNGKWEQLDVVTGNATFCKYPLSNKHATHILSFGESENKEIFILSTGYPDPNFPTGRIYQLVDPIQRSDTTICKYVAEEPKPLLKLRRRNIYYTTKGLPIPKDECIDKRKNLCKWYFGERFKANPRYSCGKFSSFSRQYCHKTCNFCQKYS